MGTKEKWGQPDLRDFCQSMNRLHCASSASPCEMRFILGTPASPLAPEATASAGDEFRIAHRAASVCTLLQFHVRGRVSQVVVPIRLESGSSPPIQIQQPGWVFAASVRRSAGPWIFGRPLHHPSPHRIAVDVGQCARHMGGPQGAGEVAVLPQVAGTACSHVEVLRIAPMHAPQQQGQRISALGQDHQMYVVGHEAPTEQTSLRLDLVVAKQAQVSEAIALGFEDRAAIDAALGDVMGYVFDNAALSAWHNLCVW